MKVENDLFNITSSIKMITPICCQRVFSSEQKYLDSSLGGKCVCVCDYAYLESRFPLGSSIPCTPSE